jgi:hypothetical protein
MPRMSDPRAAGARFELREEPDGTLFIATDGDVLEDNARALVDAFQRLTDGGREVLLIADARRCGAVTPSARKVYLDGLRSARLDAIAIFGASFSVRVMATLIMKSINLLTKRFPLIMCFETEAEARAWLLAQREALRARRRIQA